MSNVKVRPFEFLRHIEEHQKKLETIIKQKINEKNV